MPAVLAGLDRARTPGIWRFALTAGIQVHVGSLPAVASVGECLGGSRGQQPGRWLVNIRVVVAEDHPILRATMVRALDADPGIEIVGQAGNGRTALELARTLRPDVIVLDLGMPELGGAVVLERLRSELPAIRALVVTANESPESIVSAVAAGAAGYLSKATTGEQLRQAVMTTYGGGSVVTPELAGHLLREVRGSAHGEAGSVRPAIAPRELEVLRLVAQGLTDREIARELYMSPSTVQKHLTRIRQKTGLRRRSELARWAVEHSVV
jgi:DNA-binding NarL/FixJ family response regulator